MEAKRVIIVDDEMVLGQLLQAAFATLTGSIEVAVVPSAEQAAGQIKGKEIHLLVCDVKLPGISGLEFTRQLKKKIPALKVILVSGMNDPQLKETALGTGADAFFPKPVDMREFLETASLLLGLSTQTHPLSLSATIDLHSDLIIDSLINLRQELSAQSTTMMEYSGKIIASAGDFPDEDFSSRVLPYLLSAITSLQRVNAEMGVDKPENLFSIRGNTFDLLVSTLNSGYLLLVVMKKSKSPLRLAIAFDALGAAISDLQASITQSTSPEEVYRSKREEELTLVGAPGEAVLESPQEGIEKEIDAIFVKTPKKKIKVEDLDTFWEEVTSGTTFSDSTSPGLLTYEQASKLGLTPSDKEL
jgi:CheY-like chemotaxis protein